MARGDLKFERVFNFNPNFVYSDTLIREITSRRRTLDGLFFDKLLKTLNIAGAKYPPRNNKELRDLYQKTISASMADHHKQSVIYYILKDCAGHGEQDHSTTFADNHYLPERYWIYINGLWEMDRLHFQEALTYLTQPSLIPTFPEEILLALLNHTKKADRILPLAYYNTVQPAITSEEVVDAYCTYLADINVADAVRYARSRGRPNHQRLFEKIIGHVLSSKGSKDGSERSSHALQLINLPFQGDEEAWFEEYLTNGDGKKLSGAKDTVMMRNLATGKLQQALTVRQLSGRKVDGVDWEVLKDAVKRGSATDLLG